jgi:hypothetical protein
LLWLRHQSPPIRSSFAVPPRASWGLLRRIKYLPDDSDLGGNG